MKKVENIKPVGKWDLKLEYLSQVSLITVMSTYFVKRTITVTNTAAETADANNTNIKVILKIVDHSKFA